MAKNDYFVVVYRLLAYLYDCLKKDKKPDWEYMMYETKQFPVNETYFVYIFEQLLGCGYIEGVLVFPQNGYCGIKDCGIRITPKGIEFMQDHTCMKRAAQFLKSLKESIPGI